MVIASLKAKYSKSIPDWEMSVQSSFLKLAVVWDPPEAYHKCGTCVSVPARIRGWQDLPQHSLHQSLHCHRQVIVMGLGVGDYYL